MKICEINLGVSSPDSLYFTKNLWHASRFYALETNNFTCFDGMTASIVNIFDREYTQNKTSRKCYNSFFAASLIHILHSPHSTTKQNLWDLWHRIKLTKQWPHRMTIFYGLTIEEFVYSMLSFRGALTIQSQQFWSNTTKIYSACRKYLVNSQHPSMNVWVEGLP